jgi:hypothetical protein
MEYPDQDKWLSIVCQKIDHSHTLSIYMIKMPSILNYYTLKWPNSAQHETAIALRATAVFSITRSASPLGLTLQI